MATILHEKGGNYDTPVEFIPYAKLASELFSRDQKFVPFLGAGASLIAPGNAAAATGTPDASDLKIAEFCQSFDLKDEMARVLVAAAVRVALRLQQSATGPSAARPTAAPSAAELAAELAASLEYDYFEEPARRLSRALEYEVVELAKVLRRATTVTGIASTAPPLVGIASYYQYREGNTRLWDALQERFGHVTETTPIQRLVACMARHYLDFQPQDPYLCVTTNYDRLLELAMQRLNVPYCVVTVPKSGTTVRTRYSENVAERLGLDTAGFKRLQREQNQMTPDGYYLKASKPLVVIYQVHGNLDADERQYDSVVISDEDYIENIRLSGSTSRLIPNQFRTLMGYRNFLFLGYSFSDWNVRIFYKLLQAIRAAHGVESNDYAVMYRFDHYENVFFRRKEINICLTTLDRFTAGVRQEASSPCLDTI